MKKVVPILMTTMLLFSGCAPSNTVEVHSEITEDTQIKKPIFFMAGRIEANGRAEVSTEIKAEVTKTLVEIGDSVEMGDPMIQLDTKDLENQLKQAEAGVNTAQANLNKAKNGARSEVKAQAQWALESASKNYENVKSSFDRTNQLYESGAASKQQFETAQGQLAVAQAQFESAKEQLNILNNGETKETIDILKSQLEQAQAALELTKIQLSKGTITAPISGVIVDKNINNGEMTSSGKALVTIVDTNSLMVNGYLPAGLVNKFKIGQEVVLKVSEIPDKLFQGQVFVMDSVVDATGKNILVKVSIKDKDPALKSGMFAEIGFEK